MAAIGAGAVVFAGNNVLVSASDRTSSDTVVGSLGIGFKGGVGASLAVVVPTKVVEAKIGTNAVVDGRGQSSEMDAINGSDSQGITTVRRRGVIVQALSRDDITTLGFSGGGGLAVGAAGGIAVDVVEGTTRAIVESGARINQTDNNAGANAGQDVHVAAVHQLDMLTLGGALGVGAAGIAGGVDIGVLKFDTKAVVGDNVQIRAADDVAIEASANRQVESIAMSAGAGAVGLAGAVSVYTMGSGTDASSNEALDTSGRGPDASPQAFADNQSQGASGGSSYGIGQALGETGRRDNLLRAMDGATADRAQPGFTRASDSLRTGGATSVASKVGSATPSGTVASVGVGGTITAGDDVTVKATEKLSFTVFSGSMAGGAVGIGGSVTVLNVADTVTATLGGTINAGGDVTVAALLDEHIAGQAIGGTAGFVGLGAQVLIVKDTTSQGSSLREGTVITKASVVTVRASATRNLNLEASGASYGGLAAGVAVTKVTVGGETRASVGNNVQMSGINSLHVEATSTNHVSATTVGVAAGVGVAVTGNVAEINLLANGEAVAATIGTGGSIDARNEIDVEASSNQSATAVGVGVALGGGLSAGLTLVSSLVGPNVSAEVRGGSLRAGNRVRVRGRHNVNANGTPSSGTEVTANGIASAGGLVGLTGGHIQASQDVDVQSIVSHDATIVTPGEIQVRADANRDASALAGAATVGFAGVGVMESEAKVAGTTSAIFGGRAEAGRFLVTSTDHSGSSASTYAVTGGLLAAGINWARATTTTTSEALLGPAAYVTTTGDASVVARTNRAWASATVSGANVGAATLGVSDAEATIDSTTSAGLRDNAQIDAADSATVEAISESVGGKSDTSSGSGALLGLSGTESSLDLHNFVTTTLGAGAILSGQEAVTFRSLASSSTETRSTSTTLAGFAGQDASATSTVRTTARALLSTGSQLLSGGIVTILADNSVSDTTYAKTKFLGLGSLNRATATTTLTGHESLDPLAQVTFGEGSLVEGDVVNADARISRASIDSDTAGEQYSAGGLVRTTSNVNARTYSVLEMLGQSQIVGDIVRLNAALNGLNVDSYAFGKGFGVITAHDGQTFATVDARSSVRTAEGSILGGNTVVVAANTSGARLIQATKRSGAGIDTSKDDFSRDFTVKNEVVIAGVLLGIKTARLRVDAAGNITQSKLLATRAVPGAILIDRVTPDSTPGTVSLSAPRPDASASLKGGTPKPDNQSIDGTVTFSPTAKQQTADRLRIVDILNRSSLDLRINSIDTAQTGSRARIQVTDADNSASGSLADGGIYTVTGQRVQARSDVQAASNVTVLGSILNQGGVTILRAGRNVTLPGQVDTTNGAVTYRAGGSVTGTAVTTAADLTVEAKAGGIGTVGIPLPAAISQVASGKPAPGLELRSNQNLFLTLRQVATAQDILLRTARSANGSIEMQLGDNNLLVAGPIVAGPNGDVTLTGVGGIVDKQATGTDITGRNLVIQASREVASLDDPLETVIRVVEAESTGGGLYLSNIGEVTIGTIRSDLNGLRATGGILLATVSPINVKEPVLGGGDVRLVAGDTAGRTDDEVKIDNGLRIESTTGNLSLLSGDTLHLNNSHRLVAAKELTLGMDWGNADGGPGITFTVPTKSTGIITAASLRILTSGDDDTLILPEMYLPTTFEAGLGRDTVVATLLESEAPSAQTRLTNIDVDQVNFTSNYNLAATTWLVDTVIQARPLFEDLNTPVSFRTVQMKGNGFAVVENMHHDVNRLETMTASYTFGSNAEDLTVLRLDHTLNIDLGAGNDTASVGGLRDGTGAGPGEIFRPLNFLAGDGNDTFQLRDLRNLATLNPVGRFDRVNATTGLVRDYGFEQETPNSPRSVYFTGFEAARAELGPTSAIFSINNTVAPTTVEAGDGDDVINVRRTNHATTVDAGNGDDDINVQGVADLLTVRGGTNVRSLDLPEGGDRLRIGVTRTFNDNVVNVVGQNNPSTVGILGHGWFSGQEVIFSTSGTAPTGLVPGRSYFVIREDRNSIRLAATREDALAAVPVAVNIPDGGLGDHQLTMAENGKPLWGRSLTSLGTLDGTSTGIPFFTLTQPGAERSFTVDAGTDTFLSPGHGLVNGRKVALLSDGTLPGQIEGAAFYVVTNATADTFQLRKADNSLLQITNEPGSGNHVVVTAGDVVLAGNDIEKVNALLGTDRDTFVMYQSVADLQMEVRGNAGDDTFVLFEALGTSVLRGDKGFDTIRTVVHGDPHTDQFAGLQISAGIEQLLVDNSDNPQRVSWYLHEGSLYFANGSAPVSGPDLVSDVFSAAGHGFATGDRILLTSTDGLPTYLLAGGEVQTVQPGEVLYAIQLSTDTFALASSPDEAQAGTRLDFTALPAGSLTATRLSLLVGAEGAEKVLIAAGQADITGDGIPDPTGTALSSLTVLSNNELQADISGNTLRLIDGLRVLDHTNSLAKLSFPAFRVDGLEGARDVVTLATSDDRRWVIGAGTAENELAIFERRVDATKPTVAYLEYVTVKQDIHGVPAGPAQLVLSSDNRFLYVVGSGSIAVMNVIQRNGLLDLTASTAVTQSGITHFVLSQDGTLAFVADTQGVTIYDRNAGSGALVFRQRITAANVTPVASGPVKGLQGPTSLVPTADASRLFVGDAQGNLGTFERQSNGSYTLMTYVRVIRSNYEIQLRDLRVNNAFDSDNSDEVFIKYDGGSDIFNSDRSYTFPEGGGPYGLGNMPINTLPITYEFRENVSGAPDNSYGTITFNPGGATGFYRAYSFANRLDVGYQIWEPESETLQGVTFAAGASIADMRLSPDGQSLYLVTSAGKLYTVGNLDAAAGPGGVQLTSFTLLTPEDSDGNDEIYIEKGSIDFFNIDHLESFAANVVVNLTSLPVVPLGSTIRFRESNIGVTDPTYGEIQLPPGSPLGTFSTDMVVSNSTGTLRVNYRVVAGDLAQVDLETDGQSSLNGIASAQTLAFSANGKYLYVTGKRSDGNAAIVLFDIGTDNKLTLRDPNTTLLNPQFDGVGGDTSGLGTSVVGSALEGTFGAAGAFADFASSSTGGLVSFKVDADGILTFNQGPNRNAGAYPYGTGDGDPAGRVERVQGLTVNPVYREMYVVAPRDNNLYVLTEFTRVDGSQVFKVFDFYHDEADGVTGLQGAAAVTVSRDGQHVYVLTPGEPGSSHIALFDRQPDGKLLYRQNFDSVVLGGAGQPDATYRAFTGPDGTKLYVSGPAGTEVFTIAGDGSLTSLQTIVDSLSSLEFVPGSDRVFATAPSTNLVLVFDVASGLLTNRREVDPQASSPAAVVASPAIAGSMTAEAGRHVYVAAAGSNSITVYVDRLGDGNLSRLQVLREGARGIRGLEGVSALMLSAAVIDARLNILPAQVDAVQNIFTVEFHGLKTGQKIVFDTAPAGLSAGTPYFVRRLTANTFQLAGTEAEARLPGGTSIDLQASSAAASLRTDIPAGAYLYAVGTRDDSITIFERDSDPRSPTFGRLTFTQTIRNRIGNRSSGANDGLFRPDAIGAIAGDPSQVFVSSRFDPLIDQAPGGLVTFRNNAALSTQLPPIELNVEFVGMRDVAIFTGDGNDRISVLRAPKHLNQLIDLTIRSGAGNDEVTLNALGAVTTVDTGAGDDRFIVRRKDGLDPVLNATTGTGDDDIEILEVGGDTTTVTIDTGTGRDNITVEGRGIAPTNSVTLQTDANDTGLFRTEGTETAGNVQTGTTFQVAGQGAVTFGAGTLVTVENQSVVPVARAAILPGIVLQGQGVQLDASASILPTTGTITYAWDLNRDGAFTELVTSSPTVSLTWDELLDRLFMDDTFVGEMTTSIPLRVTRTVPIFDTEGKQIGEEVRESFDEAALTLRDVLATLYVQAPPSILMGEGLPPLTLILSYTDPGNDRIVAWTVSWGDGSTEIFDSEPTPTHVYRKPGVYSVEVQALDEYGQTVQTAPRTVTVTLDPSAMNPGGPYAIDEGRSLTLAGSALGDVDAGSFTWIVNGQTAGQGATLNLTWSQLTALGVTNDGTFEVRLQGTYNNGAHAVTSGPGTLVVRNLPPSATVENSGPINEDDQAFIHVRNVSDVVDVVFSYSYDFDGSGTFVPGSASQAVPASVTAKSGTNPIKVRVFDGTDFTEYETELVVREVGPTLTIQNRQTVVVIDEGAQAELPGTITNPGADAITWNATVGTVAEEGKGKWRWTYTPDDGPAGSQTVTITATDADGLSHSVTFELIVVNVGPTATFVGDTIDEGQSATVSFQQVSDPSAADRAGGFIYSYDFGDGNWITGGTSMVVPAQFLPDNGSIEVRGRIQDKDGESIFTTLVQVRNVAPSISNLTITPVANEGGLVTLEGSFTDPGVGDIHTLRIVWGDDEFDEVTLAEGERTFRVTHRYRDNDLPGGSNPGTYTVRVVLNDDDGGTTDSTQSVQVSNVTPVFGFVRGTGTNGGILLQGQYGDAGLRDGQTLQVNWGDGTTSLLRAGGRHVIDFDTDAQGNTLATGQIVRNQFVTADGRGFTVTTTRAGQPPMIFDTNAPGTNTDLGTANQAAGGPGVGLAGRPGERGENLQPLGKALIIAASRNSANPQDSERGGVLKFNFRAPVIVESIDLLDVARRGGVIRTFDARGKLVSVTRIPLGGANSLQRVALKQAYISRNGKLLPRAISRMEVVLAGGGAITRLAYRYADNDGAFALFHAMKKPGKYQVKLTLTDDDGAQVVKYLEVLVPIKKAPITLPDNGHGRRV
ncbi:MAG: PKD domain-containing protein [Gemmataceae bacterium]